jgi:chromosomal replication initiator protein
MTVELGQLWDQTLERIASEEEAPSIHGWLRTTKPLALYDDTVVIGCPNDFSKQWLELRCRQPLQRALSALVERAMSVRFVTSPDTPEPAGATIADPRFPEPAGTPGARHGIATGTGPGSGTRAGAGGAPKRGREGTAFTTQPLNSRYTFDGFVVGSGNRFAHAAAQAVAESLATVYNPLFIYGRVGLGKTHLLQAVAHHVLSAGPGSRVAYVSSESFTNELIESIRSGSMPAFRARYRNADVLLVDDIQFLAGKEATQEEFFHTFNALHESSRQIVLSSDRPPKDIPTLAERLRSRFEWGLIADIQAPDFETRAAILRRKARAERLDVPAEVLHYIAGRFDSNIRELEGALLRVVHQASLSSAGLTLATAERALSDISSPGRRPVSVERVISCVSDFYDLIPADLLAKKRTKSVAFARQVAMYLSRELTDCSLPVIGRAFGGRDHSTVLHACTRIRDQIVRDQGLAALITQLAGKVRTA